MLILETVLEQSMEQVTVMPSVLMISSSSMERLMSLIGNPGIIFDNTNIPKFYVIQMIVVELLDDT